MSCGSIFDELDANGRCGRCRRSFYKTGHDPKPAYAAWCAEYEAEAEQRAEDERVLLLDGYTTGDGNPGDELADETSYWDERDREEREYEDFWSDD